MSMAKQRKVQKETMERVMHEFKHGELETSRGKKVKNPKQAIAIGLHEAGASKYESEEENKKNLRRTKKRERKGETAKDRKEGGGSRRRTSGDSGKTRDELYAEARRRDVPGRSKMNKAALQRALH
jgi:hypothetical protein